MDAQKPTTDTAAAATTTSNVGSNKDGGFHLPGISTFGNAIQSLKETLGIDEGKPAESGDAKSSTSSGAQGSSSPAESTTSTTKKEGTFNLPTMATFDNAFQSLKGTLGLDDTKRDTDANPAKSDSSSAESGTSQPDSTSSAAKKEGGFSLPSLPSLDSTLQSIKGTLGLDDTKDGSAQPEGTASTTKKDSGFSLPSFDSTLQSIKGTLGLDDGNRDDSTKPQAPASADENSATASSESTTTTTKKEGGFNLPTLASFDNAVQSLRGTLGLDDTKKDDKAKADTTSPQPEKKEGGFSLPSISSFDDTLKSIRGTLGIDHIKSELLGKPQQPSGSDAPAAAAPETTSPVAKA